jgi:MraZ protein
MVKPYFRGQSIHRLDAKGRIRIPTRFREVLQAYYTDALIITTMKECLVAYPPEVWEKIETKALEFSQIRPQQRAFTRYFISGAVECQFDKQGRILISPLLRERAALNEEVLLAGMLTGFEIWNKESWDEHMDWSKENYQQIAEEMASFGL